MKPFFLRFFYKILLAVTLNSVWVNSFSQQQDHALFLDGTGSGAVIQNSASLSPSKAITIAGWVKPKHNNGSNRPETFVSKQKFSELDDFTNKANWEVYDATNESGANDVRGFVGGVFDGRYIYGSPWWKGGEQETSGKILRYDTQSEFGTTDSWEVYDAENQFGNGNIRGLEGAVFDGRYIYFVPLHYEGIYFGQVLRYDSQKPFGDQSSWEVFDAEPLDPAGRLKGFVGAVYDGNYIYFVPNPFKPHAKMLRYDTRLDFNSESSWSIFDLSTLQQHNYSGKGFFGAVFDGKYIYFVPFVNDGAILRLDTGKDFFSESAWTTVTFPEIFPYYFRYNFAGAAFDGRFVYFSPINQGTIVRYDTHGDFKDKDSWDLTAVANLDGQNDVLGGVGPVFDGRFVYFPPMYSAEGRSGKAIIYDTQKDFNDLTSWRYFDMSYHLDGDLRGFEGSVFDGQYVYFLPMNFSKPHGKIPRYNTASTGQLDYALEYNRSSSSFGSMLQLVTFKVGTAAGLRSISLKEKTPLADNEWHHIAATYDGKVIKLYLDGVLNNYRIYDDESPMISDDANISLGKVDGANNAGYDGFLNDLGIWNAALTKRQIESLISNGPVEAQAFWSFDEGNGGMIVDRSQNGNNSFDAQTIRYSPVIFAGADDQVCPNVLPFRLSGAYPDGGKWSGVGVSADGQFTPTEQMQNTSVKLSYSRSRTYGSASKTWSSVKNIVVHKKPKMEIIASPLAALCEDNSEITLSLAEDAAAYYWSTGATTNSITINETGTYTVNIITENHCEFESPELQIVRPELDKPVISNVGYPGLMADLEGVRYEWYLNGELLIDSVQTIKPVKLGEYEVKVHDQSGCITELSAPFRYDFGEGEGSMLVFPNPNAGIFTAWVKDLDGEVQLRILNTVGQIVFEDSVIVDENGSSLPVNIERLGIKGFYTILISGTGKTFTKKFLIH